MNSWWKKYVFGVIGVILFVWLFYTNFLAPPAILKLSGQYHVDKIMHFMGGILVVGVAISYMHLSRFSSILLLVFLIVGWEIFEVLFLPQVRHFYTTLYGHWLGDTRMDVLIGALGGLFYVLFNTKRSL